MPRSAADVSRPRTNPALLLAEPGRHRGTDRLEREQQLLINYLCNNAGGPVFYAGRDMKLSHMGMLISEEDWEIFLGHAGATFAELEMGEQEVADVVEFVTSLHDDIVEA